MKVVECLSVVPVLSVVSTSSTVAALKIGGFLRKMGRAVPTKYSDFSRVDLLACHLTLCNVHVMYGCTLPEALLIVQIGLVSQEHALSSMYPQPAMGSFTEPVPSSLFMEEDSYWTWTVDRTRFTASSSSSPTVLSVLRGQDRQVHYLTEYLYHKKVR